MLRLITTPVQRLVQKRWCSGVGSFSRLSTLRRSQMMASQVKHDTRNLGNERAETRFDDVKNYRGGLPRNISDLMHRNLTSLVDQSYIYNRPVGLSFDLITSHLIDKYERFETLEERLDFLELLSDLELQRLVILVGQKHPNKAEPTVILDNLIMECCRRFKDWDTRTLLYTADILYQINCDQKSFYRRLVSYVSGRWNYLNLTSQEILQLLFYMGYLGETSEQLMIKIENRLTENVADFGTEALSIICSVFFVVNRRVKSPELVDWIANSILEQFETLPRHQINSALKVLRHASYQNPHLFDSLGIKYYDQYKDRHSVAVLGELMEPLRCYSSLRIYNKPLLDLVCGVLSKLKSRGGSLYNLRSKDFTYILWALAVFQCKPGNDLLDYFADVLREYQSKGDFDVYPQSLVNGVMSLVLMEYFPQDLINLTLQSRQVNRVKALPFHDKYYHFLIIDASTSLECQDYKGYRLPWGFLNKLPKSVLGKINVELEGRAGLYAIYSALKEMFKEEDYVQCHFILPHFHTASIEIHLDEFNRPIKLPHIDIQKDFRLIYQNVVRRSTNQRPNEITVPLELLKGLNEKNGSQVLERDVNETFEPARKIAIEILGWNQVCYNRSERQLATSEIKQRHLQKLGYEVLLIYPEEAHSMQDYDMEHLNRYVEDKVIRTLDIKI